MDQETDDAGAEGGEEEADTFPAIYHAVPMPYDVLPVGLPEPLPNPPPVDWEAARRPTTPGPPPLDHVEPPHPDSLRMVAPYLEEEEDVLVESIELDSVPLVAKTPGSASTPAPTVPRPDSAAKPSRPAWLEALDPFYLLALYLALGIGTLFFLELEVRYTLLWAALISLGGVPVVFEARDRPGRVTTTGLGWGLFIGLVIGLPLLVTVGRGLAETAALLFPYASPAALFQSLVFVAPLGETLFFRGMLQDRRGIAASVIGAGLSNIIFFWPAISAAPAYLAVLTIFYTGLAGIYSFVRARNGLAAALVCQATINLLLVFIPGAFSGLP